MTEDDPSLPRHSSLPHHKPSRHHLEHPRRHSHENKGPHPTRDSSFALPSERRASTSTPARSPAPAPAALRARAASLRPDRQRLPITSARAKLVDMIKAHPCVIVIGETGSGKTTQLPQFLLDAGVARRVACTRPSALDQARCAT